MSLHKTLIAAVATLGLIGGSALLAGSALADDTDTARRPLHATSYGHRAPVRTGHAPAHHRPVVRPVARRVGHPVRRPVYRPAARRYPVYEARPRIHRHSEVCHFRAGHYKTVLRDVVVPGHYVEHEEPARFEVRWDRHRGGFVSVLISPRQVIREWVPRSIERRRTKVWVESRWSCSH